MAERASVDELRNLIGMVTTKDDSVLGLCLEAAGSVVYDRVLASSVRKPEVVQAVLMLAARLYKRRQSPEGVAGWDELGAVRIMVRDPDIERLLEQHVDVAKVLGIA